MARVMIIGGGAWQCPIVKLAKDMGHFVICSNLYENSPAFKYADVCLVSDVLDKEKNLEFAREYKPDAVLTDQSDIAVNTVAYVSEKIGTKGISIESASRFTNKYLMRKYTYEAGFPSPDFALCHNKEEAIIFSKEHKQSIIKPIDSQSSRGCFIINSPEDVEKNFDESIHYSNSDKAIIIEEYIDGTEFTVDGIMTDNGYIVTAISEKEGFSHNKNIAKRLLFTNSNPNFDYNKLRAVNKKTVETLGLQYGLTHAEYKYKDGEYYLIEIAARGGGTRISSDIVPIMSGINSNELLIRTVLGEHPEISKGKSYECAELGFFDFDEGKIKSISGLEEARALEGVVDAQLEVSVGDMLVRAGDDRTRCGYYIIKGMSVEEVNNIENKLLNTVIVEFE